MKNNLLFIALLLIAASFALSLVGQVAAAKQNADLRKQLGDAQYELTVAKHDLRAADDALGQCISYIPMPRHQ